MAIGSNITIILPVFFQNILPTNTVVSLFDITARTFCKRTDAELINYLVVEKSMFLIAHVSIPLDCSKHFTLPFLFNSSILSYC